MFVVLFFGVVGAVAWLAVRAREPEPVYQGKSLSEWVTNYNGNFVRWEDMTEAVRQMGTNAIPTLLRKMRARDTRLKDQLIALARKQHVIKVSHTPASVLNEEGERGFLALGADGRDAVPALAELYQWNSSNPKLRCSLAKVLGGMGPAAKQAVPALIQGLGDTNNAACASAIIALGRIHSEPGLAVPALVKCLGRQDGYIPLRVAYTLAEFGADAKPAIPALVQLLQGSDENVRTAVQIAVKRIDPEAGVK